MVISNTAGYTYRYMNNLHVSVNIVNFFIEIHIILLNSKNEE